MLDLTTILKKVFDRLDEDDPRYLMFFLKVNSKGKKKHIGPFSI